MVVKGVFLVMHQQEVLPIKSGVYEGSQFRGLINQPETFSMVKN